MGTDIHGFIEVKIKGKWYAYEKIKSGYRNYDMFELIGAWESDKAVVKPKGVPPDASTVVKLEVESWENDGHWYTWLSKAELDEVVDTFLKSKNKAIGDILVLYKEGLAQGNPLLSQLSNYYGNEFHMLRDHKYEDIRVIFWFDY